MFVQIATSIFAVLTVLGVAKEIWDHEFDVYTCLGVGAFTTMAGRIFNWW